jgi:hypothetical protein
MADRTLVRSIWSADHKHRLDIFERDDGRYDYAGISQLTEDGDTFWAPTDFSGIYETVDSAEQEALALIPWLKPKISN